MCTTDPNHSKEYNRSRCFAVAHLTVDSVMMFLFFMSYGLLGCVACILTVIGNSILACRCCAPTENQNQVTSGNHSCQFTTVVVLCSVALPFVAFNTIVMILADSVALGFNVLWGVVTITMSILSIVFASQASKNAGPINSNTYANGPAVAMGTPTTVVVSGQPVYGHGVVAAPTASVMVTGSPTVGYEYDAAAAKMAGEYQPNGKTAIAL